MAVAGKYAFLGTGKNLIALDISVPTHPVLVAKAEIQGTVEGLRAEGGLIYAAAGAAGLRVFRWAKGTMTEVGHVDSDYHVWDVAVASRYVFLAAHDRGFVVMDTASPKGFYELGGIRTEGLAFSCTVAGRYLYMADGLGLRVARLSEHQLPKEVGFLPTAGAALNVTVQGNHAYVAAYDQGIRVIDISRPHSPKEIGSLPTPGLALALAVEKSFAFVASGAHGLRVIDVSDPRKPRETAFLQTPGYAEGVATSGSLVFVADTETLRIIDVSNPRNPRELSFFDPRRESEFRLASAAEH